MTIFESWTSILATLATTFFIIIYGYYRWSFLHWHRLKVPYLQPSIPFGNCGKSLTGNENFAVTVGNLYNQIKQNGWKHGGMFIFVSPNYIPANLDYVKNILVNDFHHFTDRAGYYNKKHILSANLIVCRGAQWRRIRSKMTPCFSPSKMKKLFNILHVCQNGLVRKMETEVIKNEAVDIHKIFIRYTLDIVGLSIYGSDLKAYENETTPFKVFAKKIANKTTLERLFVIFVSNFPNLAQKLNLSSFPKDLEDFFVNIVRNIVDFREKHESHNDFLQLFLDMKNDDADSSLTIEEIAAQCFALTVAGLETTASLLTSALYELARNPEIQEKLRSEIDEILAKHNGEVSYDSIQEMKYLSQVLDESMRKYPPTPHINRECVKDYKIPDEDVVLKKGTIVVISILGIHHDEDYYPNPEKFDPERFSEENKKLRNKYAFLPFGAGPRTCIGLQFGLIEVKLGLISMIRNFKFTVGKKTLKTLKMRPNNYIFTAVGGILLNVTKI